jgi:hypothetical protein
VSQTFNIAAAPLSCAVPPSGMVSWWPGDGNTNDIAGNANNGTLSGDAAFGSGKVSQAFSFNGAGFVQVPHSALWDFGSGDFTIDLWANWNTVNASTYGAPATVFVGDDDGGGMTNKWFFAHGGGLLEFHINNTAQYFFIAQTPFTPVPGTWYHLAVTKASGTYTIYVNGSAIGSDFNTYGIPTTTAPLTIGKAESLGFMNGLIDEVEIFSRALSGSEIGLIYSAGSIGKCKAPGTNLSVTPVSAAFGGTASLHATLTLAADNSAISGKLVNFTLNGYAVGSATTDEIAR